MGQQLTTLTAFKSWYDFKGNVADDALLTSLIDQCSADILNYLDRKTCLKNTYTEYYNGWGGKSLLLRQWPVLSVSSVAVDAIAISAASPPYDGYFLDPWDGFLPGQGQYVTLTGYCFSKGLRNVAITYVGGYVVTDEAGTVPSSGAATIKAEQTWGTWAKDEGVENASTGVALTKVTGAPSTGEYSVADGVYTFSSADAGLAVLISYSYTPAPLVQACREMVGERYSYRSHIGQTSHAFQGNTTVAFDNKGLTDYIKMMIQPYKRMVPY